MLGGLGRTATEPHFGISTGFEVEKGLARELQAPPGASGCAGGCRDGDVRGQYSGVFQGHVIDSGEHI